MVEFDPKVEPWKTPQVIEKFTGKHFNRSPEEEEREATSKDFPRPNSKAFITPKLDDLVRGQLKK